MDLIKIISKTLISFFALSVSAQLCWSGTTERVSVGKYGTQANGMSYVGSISDYGRFVSFSSYADNLVTGDSNGFADAFVRDRLKGETTMVSVSSTGAQGNDWSMGCSLSADGRLVGFRSAANNLVQNDTNNCPDVFLHDRITGQTTRISVSSIGGQANNDSWYDSISSDGRFVTFSSLADNLVPDDTNDCMDVFVHDRKTGATTRISVNSEGEQGNDNSSGGSISRDGRFVAFSSDADNLVTGDTNGLIDVFVYDRQTGATTRASVNSDGEQAIGESFLGVMISNDDGRFVAFQSGAGNLVPDDTNINDDVFVHDLQTGATTRISVNSDGEQANGMSGWFSVSADGRFFSFMSSATNLVPDDTNDELDIFVHDRRNGKTNRVSVNSDGEQANDYSWGSSISPDGRFVAFDSAADNLVSDDTNGEYEVFVHDRYIEIQIDIKPGSTPNTINLKSKGMVPVAILTTDDFDAFDVDPVTCEFAGAHPIRWNMKDVDHDGDHDMLFHFMTQELDLTKESIEARVECETFEGMLITGTNTINVIPKVKKTKKEGNKKASKAKTYLLLNHWN